MWEVSCLSEDLLVSQASLLHDFALIQQCRLLDGRKQFLAELTAVPSCYRMCSSVPSVKIALSSPLCSFSQHSALQSALFLQSKFHSPVSSVPSVNIPLSSPLCSFSQNSTLQSALFLQSKFRSPVRSVPSVKIPLSSPLCSFSQNSALQSALFLQSKFHSPVSSVPSVNIPFSSPLCSSSQHSALQSAPLRHIKPITLSEPRSYKH